VASIVWSVGVAVVVLLTADLYLHRKYAPTFGVNVWGYRGDPRGPKAANETRIIVLGGSTAFGYGVFTGQDFPALLERRLDGWNGRRVSFVNAGFNNHGVYSFLDSLQDYAYLDYDAVVLYEGYNDLTPGSRNLTSARRQSPVFRWTGYFPILPMILSEKMMVLMNPGKSLDEVYQERAAGGAKPDPAPAAGAPVVFIARANDGTDAALAQANQIVAALRRQVGALSAPGDVPPLPAGCDETPERRWYCELMGKSIEYALLAGKRVLVVGQPAISDLHVQQQRALQGLLEQRFGGDPRVRYYDVARQIDLSDRTLASDGMHLTVAGTERLAAILEDPVRQLLLERPPTPR
jgi:lysophospholipase L1-like esterase